tara:strand:- start:4760 stop:5029 length:270 start_codon:yes stop_codon:yes gene_type:complete
MSITKDKMQELVNENGKNSEDTGATESQVAIFTERIRNLTDHLKVNKKDKSAQRGLMLLVAKRARLLKYLKKNSLDGYRQLIEKLDLRK